MLLNLLFNLFLSAKPSWSLYFNWFLLYTCLYIESEPFLTFILIYFLSIYTRTLLYPLLCLLLQLDTLFQLVYFSSLHFLLIQLALYLT